MKKKMSTEEYSDKVCDYILARAIAERKYEIKKLQARVKQIEVEITKIKSGELVPDADIKEASKVVQTIGGYSWGTLTQPSVLDKSIKYGTITRG